MLVLTRRKNERIVIGEGIVVTVLSIQGNKVRLGIEAPPEIHVHREEIVRSIQSYSPLVPVPQANAPTLLVAP